MDDAGVYALNDNTAIVQTVDILTPVADDPHIFGQIAAANSLSDVYAMGATPITALCFVGFPVGEIDNETIRTILEGVTYKIKETEACLIGGHTTKDVELKCGLAVTGIVAPDKVVTKNQAKPGDAVVLTKPLGMGVISTAAKVDAASDQAVEKANFYMCQLNKIACEVMTEIGVSSATDVTGFGLLGHASEMAELSDVSIIIHSDQVPIIEEAFELAKKTLFPGGTVKNFEFIKPRTEFARNINFELQMLLSDAQTSGGLLISVPKERSHALLYLLRKKGVSAAQVIGEITEPRAKRIYVE